MVSFQREFEHLIRNLYRIIQLVESVIFKSKHFDDVSLK